MISLVAGAAANIAVAWIWGVSVKTPDPGPDGYVELRHHDQCWTVFIDRATVASTTVITIPCDDAARLLASTRVPRLDADVLPGFRRQPDRVATVGRHTYPVHIDFAVGWPFRCVAHSVDANVEGDAVNEASVSFSHGLRVGRFPRGSPLAPRVLSYRPIVLGLVAGSVFYALPCAAIAAGLLWTRDRYRRGRGRCPRCKYDLRSGGERTMCPECGWTERSAAPADP